jgi:hypothetical protein
MKETFAKYALRILKELGIKADENNIPEGYVSNEVQTDTFPLNGAKVRISIAWFDNDRIRIDIDFSLPEDGVLADTFMNHCAAIEGTPKNHHHEYCAGPTYPDYTAELYARKHTFALSPWHNTFFYVRSEGYAVTEIDEAVTNAVTLAKQFSSHLGEYASLRYWKTSDPEVVAKAKEIVTNADLQDSDCDRETGGHWLTDRNSFFKGWFHPFNNRGRGTFDTLWPSSVGYAAGRMGLEGSIEYAVASILLEDADFIAKARKACIIRKETRTVQF